MSSNPISLLSIDPGTKNLGWAHFRLGLLWATGCSRTTLRTRDDQVAVHKDNILRASGHAVRGALESMVYNPRRKGSVPKDLLDVQMVGGLVLGSCVRGTQITYAAHRWKGQVPKAIHHERIVKVLSPYERNILDEALSGCPRGNHKEILDAMGIGLYDLGRTRRGGGAT